VNNDENLLTAALCARGAHHTMSAGVRQLAADGVSATIPAPGNRGTSRRGSASWDTPASGPVPQALLQAFIPIGTRLQQAAADQ